jgi:hypothetical protein
VACGKSHCICHSAPQWEELKTILLTYLASGIFDACGKWHCNQKGRGTGDGEKGSLTVKGCDNL